jgi:hypothetical protein
MIRRSRSSRNRHRNSFEFLVSGFEFLVFEMIKAAEKSAALFLLCRLKSEIRLREISICSAD